MNGNSVQIVMGVCFMALLVLVVVSVAVVPWLTGRRELFGVTVPPAAHDDPHIRRCRIAYGVSMAVYGAVALIVAVLIWRIFGMTAFIWAVGAGMLVAVAVGFALQQVFRRRIMAIKRERSWTADGAHRVAVVGESMPQPPSLWWDLIYVPIIVVSIIIGYAGYDGMPQHVPMHAGVDGVVDSWADKSPWLLWQAPGMALLLAVVMVVVHAAIVYTRRLVDPGRPRASAWAFGMFRRAWGVYTLVAGALLTAGLGLGMQLSMIGMVDLNMVGLIGMAVAVAAIAGAVVIGVTYGQSGSKLVSADSADGAADGAAYDTADGASPEAYGDDDMSEDDDRFWRGGILYWNPDDPAVVVPKRFGVGWTVNCARPVVWLCVIVFIALLVALLTLL